MNLSARQFTRTRLISANGACGQMRFNAAHAGGFTTEKGASMRPTASYITKESTQVLPCASIPPGKL